MSGTSSSGFLVTEVLPIEDLRSTRSSNGVKLSVENGQSQDGVGLSAAQGIPSGLMFFQVVRTWKNLDLRIGQPLLLDRFTLGQADCDIRRICYCVIRCKWFS